MIITEARIGDVNGHVTLSITCVLMYAMHADWHVLAITTLH